MNILRLLAACAACVVAGCSITGFNASSSYACKAPEGVKCASVSGTYHNAIANNLPSQRNTSTERAPQGAPAAAGLQHALYDPPAGPLSSSVLSASTAPTASRAGSPTPLRSGPRILRLWIKPWEDSDGDLNGESLVYLQIDGGRWLVDHAQRQVREAYAPVRAPAPRMPSSSNVSQARPPSSADAAARPAVPHLPAVAAAAIRAAQDEQSQHGPSPDDN